MTSFHDLLGRTQLTEVELPSRITERLRNTLADKLDTWYPGSRILYSDNTTDKIFGGLSLKNKRGRIQRRIRSNLYKNFGVRVQDKHIEELGNIINDRAQSPGIWNFTVELDLAAHIEAFPGGGNCFRPKAENHHHLLAMQDSGLAGMLCIYDEDEDRHARAWLLHNSADGAMVLFNGYSRNDPMLRLRQMGAILAADINIPSRRVAFETDVFSNVDWAIALGGTRSVYRFWFEPEDVTFCRLCEKYVFQSDMTHTTVEHSLICTSCFAGHESNQCERCERYCLVSYSNYNYDLELCAHCVREISVGCRGCGMPVIADDNENLIRVRRSCTCCYDSRYYCPDCYGGALKSLKLSDRLFGGG